MSRGNRGVRCCRRTAAAAGASSATSSRAGADRPRVHRGGREHELRERHWQFLHAVPQRPGSAIRPGDTILRRHAPLDWELLHAHGWRHRDQQRQLLRADRDRGQCRAGAPEGGQDVEVLRRGPPACGVYRPRCRGVRPPAQHAGAGLRRGERFHPGQEPGAILAVRHGPDEQHSAKLCVHRAESVQ